MGFDTSKFQKQEFSYRIRSVKVEALTAFFEENEDPLWEVRGLSVDEIYKSNEAAANAKMLEGIIEGLAGSKTEIAEAIKKLTGQDSNVSDQTSKRLQQLTFGSVNPKISLENAVKLAETFPIEFMDLTNEILKLTGLGKVLGKPKPCGDKEISKLL